LFPGDKTIKPIKIELVGAHAGSAEERGTYGAVRRVSRAGISRAPLLCLAWLRGGTAVRYKRFRPSG